MILEADQSYRDHPIPLQTGKNEKKQIEMHL